MTQSHPQPDPPGSRSFLIIESDPQMCPTWHPVSDLPGIVIFVHGVNDPGGNYDIIEDGICEGLNERLDAFRLVPGRYGEAYAEAQASTIKVGDRQYNKIAKIKYDPDTYLYERQEREGEVGKRTHSVFIPFYWGYRASEDEIARKKPEDGGTADGYSTIRGQYHDHQGNRLSKHFAKGGGMFNNATTSLPLMFEAGFRHNFANAAARLMMSGYEYSTHSPHRRSMVLAAERLAMLIREIRAVSPDETINVIGHSQGTMVTLLAQAMLADGSEVRSVAGTPMPTLPAARPADCLLLVDSPYSLIETTLERIAHNNVHRYTAKGRLKTLSHIVNLVTSAPHPAPPLSDLAPVRGEAGLHRGRAGYQWKGLGPALRRQRDGQTFFFDERDNRGKVYMYYCPEDGTVNIPTVKGIGTYGVPDALADKWTPAMSVLKDIRFFQRAFSRGGTDDDGQSTDVGVEPGYRTFHKRPPCFINGEPISPPFTPAMYGGEAVQGTADKAGVITPNDYAKDLYVGNPDEDMPLVLLHDVDTDRDRGIPDGQALLRAFNKDKDPNDQSYAVKVRMRSHYGVRPGYRVYREETPNETRARIMADPKLWQENSYHSAILSHRDNLRRVAAMDLAVGQAKALDDHEWRKLFLALADWKMTVDSFSKVTGNPKFAQLSDAARALAHGCYSYYEDGDFPAALVRESPPAGINRDRLS